LIFVLGGLWGEMMGGMHWVWGWDGWMEGWNWIWRFTAQVEACVRWMKARNEGPQLHPSLLGDV